MEVTPEVIKKIRKKTELHIADALPYYFNRSQRSSPTAVKNCSFYYCSFEALQHPWNLNEGWRVAILSREAEWFAKQRGISYKKIHKKFAAVRVAVIREKDLPCHDSKTAIEFLPLPAEFVKQLGLSSNKPSRKEIFEVCKNPEFRKYYPLLIANYMYNMGHNNKVRYFVDHTGDALYFMKN